VKKAAAKKAVKKAAAKKAVKKTAAKKAVKKAAAKKAVKKTVAKKAVKKAAAKKAVKKTIAKRALENSSPKKAAKKTVAAKSAKKSASKKVVNEAAKKATALKNSDKQAAKKKTRTKKASAKVPPEKQSPEPAKQAPVQATPALEAVAEAPSEMTPAPEPAASTNGNNEAGEVSNLQVSVGQPAKDFSLKDQNGSPISSADLAGKPYVLYFYPKDNTPGCTQEACDFRDDHSAFVQAGIEVFGVSPDSVASHAGFAAKHELPFRLISDPDKQLATAYGVWAKKKNYGREYMGIVRSTFLIGPEGTVLGAWDQVKVKGHVQEVLDTISRELGT
jgi:peroxiredoxin Q/BCP